MTSNNNCNEIAKRQLNRAKAVKAAVKTAQTTWGVSAKQRLFELSDGKLDAAHLATIKPGLYSVMRISNPAFDAIINNQKGALQNGWRVSTLVLDGNVITMIANVAPEWKWMSGTSKMRNRPIIDKLFKDVPLFPLLLKAVNDALRSI